MNNELRTMNTKEEKKSTIFVDELWTILYDFAFLYSFTIR